MIASASAHHLQETLTPPIMALLLGRANDVVEMCGELWRHLLFLGTHTELQGATHMGVLLLIRRI